MLLMTRRVGEGLVINGTIELKILEVRGGRVKIGCEFPAGNTVYRQELFLKIQEENQAAARVAGGSGKGNASGTPIALEGVLARVLPVKAAGAGKQAPAKKDTPHEQPEPNHQPAKPRGRRIEHGDDND